MSGKIGRLISIGFLACAAATAAGEGAATGDFFVAPGGKDNNPGTEQQPFATLARARDEVRVKIAAGLKAPVTVLIRGGTYEQGRTLAFGPIDSGTEACPVTYAAYPGEQVVLSGGRKISGWKKGAGEVWTVELPEVKAGRWYFRQLFINGRRATRARTPNADEAQPWWRIKSSDANPGAPDQNSRPIVLGVDHPVRAWKNIADVELVYLNNNDGSRKRVGAVDEAAQTITLPPPHQWPPDVLPGEYQIGHPVPFYSCYFENALEMLDRPGEWYLDRKTGVLSYWPLAGEDPGRAEVVAPVVQNTLLDVTGTREYPVHNLHFKGLRVEYVDWPLPAYGFAAMFGCLQITSEGGKPPVRFFPIEAAVSFRHARACNFTDGGVAYAGGIGLSLRDGCARNVIEGNQIHDLGGGGITAGMVLNRDTWQWAEFPAPDDHQGYRIANNHVHHCGSDYFGAVGIMVSSTQDALVSHNLIHDLAYAGIVLCGNETPRKFARNNRVEFNHIHHVMQVAMDGAGIYASFPHEGDGAVLRGNLIHHLARNIYNPRPAGGYSAAGIYMDGVRWYLGCKTYTVEENVIFQTHNPLFLLCASEEGNTFRNNLFLKQGAPPRATLEAMLAKAGLEPAYRKLAPEPVFPPWPDENPAPVPAPQRPRASLPRTTAAVTVDGALDEAAWKTAGAITALQREDGWGESAVATRVLALSAPDALYLAGVCAEPVAAEIVAQAKTRDEDQVWQDDCLEFFVEPVKGSGEQRHFVVSASGCCYDSRNKDKVWNGDWRAAVRRTAEGWQLEARIPWAALGLDGQPKTGSELGFNVGRLRNAAGEGSQWSPTEGSSHQPAKFGTLKAE